MFREYAVPMNERQISGPLRERSGRGARRITRCRRVDTERSPWRYQGADDEARLFGPLVLIHEPIPALYRIHEKNSIHEVAKFIANAHRLLANERAGRYPGGTASLGERYAALGAMSCSGRRRACVPDSGKRHCNCFWSACRWSSSRLRTGEEAWCAGVVSLEHLDLDVRRFAARERERCPACSLVRQPSPHLPTKERQRSSGRG